MTPPAQAARPAERYRTLDDAQIIATVERLHDRIDERFPGSGLGRVAGELRGLAGEAADCVAYLRRPHWPVRASVALALAAMVGALVVLAARLSPSAAVSGWLQVIQAAESAVNDVVFLAIAVYFLLTVETRVKRRRALKALHELRSVIHIVDMYQLTKDPDRLLSGHADTASSPARTMTRPELGRYLDYCSELLSLSSKVAALFVQHFNDPVVLSTVNDLETLTTGISGKIWQKITLLQRIPVASAPATGPSPSDDA